MVSSTDLGRSFERQQHRRRAGTPLVCVTSDGDAWAAWAEAMGRRVAIVEPSERAVVRALLHAIDDRLHAAALALLGAHATIPSRDHRTREHALVREQLVRVAGSEVGELAADLLLAERIRDDSLELLPTVAELVGPEHWPALRLDSGELHERVRVSLAVAELVPRLPIVLVGSDVIAFARSRPDSRQKAILREGIPVTAALMHTEVLHAEVPGEGASAECPAASTECPAALRERLLALRDRAEVDPKARDEARSLAERLLANALERHPATRGLFVLNGVLPHRFGNRDIEIDLLAESRRIAVEIDGFHHFREPADYRRDRRKDVLMQQIGLFIYRVLADDVVEDTEAVVDDIVTLVRSRT